MLGFHRRSRSLISVKNLDEKAAVDWEDDTDAQLVEMEETEIQTPRWRRNMTMICLLFLAEAIMASSLSSQITVLVSGATGCTTMNTSFLSSIFECAYFLGSTSGVFWGWLADKIGRRNVALIGLGGMATCCVSMGFATSFASFAVLRFFAGAIASAVTVAGLAMMADATHSSMKRVHTVARLPLLAVCGSTIGPLAAHSIRRLGEKHLTSLFAQFPALGGQIACASMVSMIGLAEFLLLEETLPQANDKLTVAESHVDCEKAAFLRQPLNDDTDEVLSITLMDAPKDIQNAPPPTTLSLVQLLGAPSLLMLLASYSLLSLHSATFDLMLPHLGHTASHASGLGIACSWLQLIMLAIQVLAALRILKAVPFISGKVGVLEMYRKISLVFPIAYLVIPLVGWAVTATGSPSLVSAVFSVVATLVKTTLAGAAQVLVVLLVLSMAPDAESTGTVIGVVSLAGIFKALAVSLVGMSYYMSDDYSMAVVNGSLWASLALISVVGAAISWRLREAPRVGTDIPEETLTWQGIFDTESEDGGV